MRRLLVTLSMVAVFLTPADAPACSPAPGWTPGPPTYYISTINDGAPDGTAAGTYLMSRGGHCGQDFNLHRPVSPRYLAVAKPARVVALIALVLCGIAWMSAFVSWVRRRRSGADAPGWLAHTNDPFVVMVFALCIAHLADRLEMPARLYCEPHRLEPAGIAFFMVFATAAMVARIVFGHRGRGRLGAMVAAGAIILGMIAVSSLGLSPPTSGKCHEEARYVEIDF